MSQSDRHITTEQLSAFLDGQAEKQTSIEEHLKSCAQCQLQLANLRQMAAFLGALPQPQLPRSFMLPVDTCIIPTEDAHTATTGTRIIQHIQAWPRTVRNTLRAVSTIAAILGIIFLLSAIPLPHSGTTTAANSVSYQKKIAEPVRTPPEYSSGTGQAAKTATSQVQPSLTMGNDTATAQAREKVQQTPSNGQPSPYQYSDDTHNPLLASPDWRILGGIFLLILSLLGMLLLRLLRRKNA